MPNTTAHLLLTDTHGQPCSLDRQRIDLDARARLATPAQRIALGFPDQRCAFPGCGRPALWPLEAHHLTPTPTTDPPPSQISH